MKKLIIIATAVLGLMSCSKSELETDYTLYERLEGSANVIEYRNDKPTTIHGDISVGKFEVNSNEYILVTSIDGKPVKFKVNGKLYLETEFKITK